MVLWLLCLACLTNAQLDASCEAGDYEVTGHKTGVAVQLNYTSSYVHKDADTTFLTLDFIVPSMYFYDNQDVNGNTYDRSFQITFHDRTLATQVQNACYGNRQDSGGEYCTGGTEQWTETVDSADQCLTIASGKLPWDKLMREAYHDVNRIEIQTSSRDVNGFDTPTWEVYMVAAIETWAGFEQVSTTVNGQNPGQLTINQERYSYFEIPFRISFPKQITLVASPIRIAAPMVTLYAVVKQEIININFNPQNGENFGQVQLDIVTQTQYPFALRNSTDDTAPAVIRTTSGDILSVEWISNDGPDSCTSVTGAEDNNLCEQTWTILITPNLCDVSGSYQMEMYAICFTDVDGCALDDNAGDQSSNTWTGYMDFEVQAQDFCPTVIDEITVQGTIGKFADNTYVVEAVPGSNVFSNDHVWFEVTYVTRSAKSGLTFSEGDDSLIEFVRPYRIDMAVAMNAEPLQTEVVRDHGDVSGDTLSYTVNLCTATPAVYPYTNVVDDCFTADNKGWNAINYLDFGESVNNVGDNTIDANEIGFQLRLDERVIPVDIPNDQAVITIQVESEVYYFGNNNPTRRKLKYTYPRRNLQGEFSHRQSNSLSETFTVPKRESLVYCVLNTQREEVGFQIDVEMDRMALPERNSIFQHVSDLKVGYSNYFHASLNDIEIVAVHACDNENDCAELYNIDRSASGQSSSSTEFARYYVKARGVELATTMQNDFYQHGPVYQTEMFDGTVVRSIKCDHCDNDLDTYMSQELIPNWSMKTGDSWNGLGDSSTRPQIDESSAASLSAFFGFILFLLF